MEFLEVFQVVFLEVFLVVFLVAFQVVLEVFQVVFLEIFQVVFPEDILLVVLEGFLIVFLLEFQEAYPGVFLVVWDWVWVLVPILGKLTMYKDLNLSLGIKIKITTIKRIGTNMKIGTTKGQRENVDLLVLFV